MEQDPCEQACTWQVVITDGGRVLIGMLIKQLCVVAVSAWINLRDTG